MKQTNKYIITVVLLTIIVVLCTPRKKKIIENLFGKSLDIKGTAEKIFNDIMNPIKDAIYNAINIIPNNIGTGQLVRLVEHLSQMANPTINIITNTLQINEQSINIINTIVKDTGHITNVTPTITNCIKRIEYCRQRISNIYTCTKLLELTVKHFSFMNAFKAMILLYRNILETINFIKMAMRTSFIDLHNTSPPLWEVISVTQYKKIIVLNIKYTKKIVISINTLLDKLTLCLKDIQNFLSQPSIINELDTENIDREIKKFHDVLNHQIAGVKIARIPMTIFDIPIQSISISNKILYNIIKKTIEGSTVPPEYDFNYNVEYINTNIKNNPYPLK